MRPPQQRGGNPAEAQSYNRPGRRFNEAPPAKGGECPARGQLGAGTHGFNEAPPAKGGNHTGCLHPDMAISASMRPPQQRGGNLD